MTNCGWVVLASIIASEPTGASRPANRPTTQHLFQELAEKNITIDNKEIMADDYKLPEKARGLGRIDDTYPLCSIDDLPTKVKGLPQRKTFGVGIRCGSGFGHWVLGYVDGDFVRLTDYQKHDNGEYYNDEMRKKKGIGLYERKTGRNYGEPIANTVVGRSRLKSGEWRMESLRHASNGIGVYSDGHTLRIGLELAERLEGICHLEAGDCERLSGIVWSIRRLVNRQVEREGGGVHFPQDILTSK